MHDVISLTKQPVSNAPKVAMRDLFEQDLARGAVVGSTSTSGAKRTGVDVERLISVDHGAMRFGQLVRPGWGRQGIAYGPFQRANGLAMAAFLVNGHNSSRETNLGEPVRKRIKGWLTSSQTGQWGWRWPLLYKRSHKKQNFIEKLRRWRASNRLFRIGVTDNLAVGWFAKEAPQVPAAEGNGFIVDAAFTGEPKLRPVVGNTASLAVAGLQANQVYYVVVLREQGAAYYAASLPGARGLGAYPDMRPLAIDAFRDDATVYAGVHQAVQGEIGFTAETRVYGVHVEQVEELSHWYGTAHVADALTGDGDLAGSEAELSGRWQVALGELARTADGITADDGDAAAAALLTADAPSGLVHVVFDAPSGNAAVQLIWRARDEKDYWSFGLERGALELKLVVGAEGRTIACLPATNVNRTGPNALQVVDDGRTFSVYLNGILAFDRTFTDGRFADECGVGFAAGSGAHNVRRFEAHPRTVPIPPQLDLGAPWEKQGTDILVADDFGNAPPRDLEGRMTPIGNRPWRREIGKGTFETTGTGAARVAASLERPNPLRTAYSIPWENAQFADVTVDVTPPGTRRGEGHRGRGGILFWQDPENYLIISLYLDDCIETASLAGFFLFKGIEDVYDAVWSNLGPRIQWGERFTLRVAFDGMRFVGYINGEPVLYRALTDVYPTIGRLSLNRIGLVANWEWGDDTGTLFHNFVGQA